MVSMYSVISWWYVSFIIYSLQLVSCVRFTADITLYTHPLPWNEARRVCEENGGTLLETQHDHLYDFVQEFKTSDPWEDYRNITSFWIGVFNDYDYDTWTPFHIPDDIFSRWSSNCELVPADTQILEKNGVFKCVAEDMNSPGSWTSGLCGDPKPFVCLKETMPNCDTDTRLRSTLKEALLTTGQVTQLTYFGSKYDVCSDFCQSDPTCWAFVHNDNNDCFRYSTTNMSGLLDPDNYDHSTTSRLTLLKCHHAFVNTTVFSDSSVLDYFHPDVPCSPYQETTAQANTTLTEETTSADETTVISETSTVSESTLLEEKSTTEKTTTLEKTAERGDKVRTTVRTRIASTTTTPESSSTVGAEGLVSSTNTLQGITEETTTPSLSYTHLLSQSTSPSMSSYTTSSTSGHTSPLDVHSDVTTPAQHSATPDSLFTSTSSDSWGETIVTLPNISSNVSDEFCVCGCSSDGMTETEKSEFIAKILKELTKDKANFSSTRRRYISVMDERPSAQNVGVVGVILLTVAFGGIILLDLSTLGRDLSNLKKNVQSLLGKQSSETI